METEVKLTSQKMRDKKMIKLIIEMSLPAILSMLVLSLYNIVDSIFVAKYDPRALEALSIVFPLQQLIIAFGVGIGVGTNAYVSRKLGQGKLKEATLTAQTGLFLAMVCGILFVIVGLFATKPFVMKYTSDEVVIGYAVTYLQVVMCLSIFSFIDLICNKVLQATGNMRVPMLTQIMGAITNIVLDPIFIFVFKMGVLGAGIATVIGQIVAMSIGVLVFKFQKQDVTIFFNKEFRLKSHIIKGILKIGFPVMVMNAIMSVVTTVLNLILRGYKYAITILGIYFKIQSFVFMPVFGLNQGTLPILSYNYGAKDKKRFVECYKLSVIFAVSIMTLGTILFMAIPEQFMIMFDSPPEMIVEGAFAMRILSLCFILAGYGITTTNMLQGLRKGFVSLLVSLMRQLVLLVPFAIIFSKFFGLRGVWFAYPTSELIVVIIFLFTAAPLINKKFAKATVNVSGASEALCVEDTDAHNVEVESQVKNEL